MTAKQIAGYLKARRDQRGSTFGGITFNDGYNVPTFGITQAQYSAINRAMHDEYGTHGEPTNLTPAVVKKALKNHLERGGTRHHATKKTPAKKSSAKGLSQYQMFDEASRKAAEANRTFLELLPTLRRKELERLIEKRPALWGRFAGYLTSGHVFVDDPEAGSGKGSHHATRKAFVNHASTKSPAQLQREIDEALDTPKKASPLSEMAMFNDLNRQGFMRNVYAKPKRKRTQKPLPPTVSCDACMNWHPQGRHTAPAAQRKINLVKMRELRGGGSAHSTRRQTPTGAHQKWNVYSGGKLIDAVFYVPSMEADDVRRGLINHDGYPSDIRVRRAR
jgi:hypothetical protein